METLSLQSGARGSLLSLDNGILSVSAGRYQGMCEFVQLSSCSTSGRPCALRKSRCLWELKGRKKNRRHGSGVCSFLNGLPPIVADSGFGERISLVLRTVFDSTAASLNRIAGDSGKLPLPAHASEEISKSLEKIREALSEVAVDTTGAERVIRLSAERVQTILSDLLATTSSSVGTLGRSFGLAKETLDGSGADLQNHIHQIGLQNAVVQQKLQEIWQTTALLGSPLAGTDTGVLLVAETPNGLQDATSIGSAVRSSIDASASLEHLLHSATGVLHQTQLLTTEVGLQASNLVNGIAHVDLSSFQASADHLILSTGNMVGNIATAVGGPYFATSSSSAATLVAATAGSVVVVVSSASLLRSKGFTEGEDLPLRYDAQAIIAYFRRRPLDILSRAVRIALQCSALAASVVLDFSTGEGKQNEAIRAGQLVDLIARLGPTAIKIGQALSIRPDILPVAYLEELQKLQDRVPPFSNVEARQLILEGLGKSAEEIFEDISADPIAAASLGQVYKARLKETGQAVAIKVQRPGVLEGISRDLFILRATAYALERLPMVKSDLVSLLDNWAIRFFDELDYVQEAKNAQRFAEDMKGLPNVTVPDAYLTYTSRKILTSAWVEGEKLSESRAADLLPLVTVALNCYLIQLLESGFLHADPHPGNLLRTPDGRLCVLDFGLMTEVTEEQRYALIEYISHLVNSDYARVAEDLVRLGFVPPEFVDPEKTAAVVPQLSRVFAQLVQGGGARKMNVGQVIDDLAKIGEDYVFVIPPYFALILRAFSVLEGIGLEADPDYAIVDQCYPYISKRLITDDSARTRAALKYFLYAGKDQLDVKRVEDIAGGFRTFRDLMAPVGGSQKPKPSIDPSTKQALLLVFASEGSYLQELLLTELVRSVDALSREARAAFWHLIATGLRLPVPAAMAAQGSWPLFLPGLFWGSSPVASLSYEDQEAIDTIRRLWSLLEPQLNRSSAAEIVDSAQDLMPLLRQLFPGVTTASQRFVVMLVQRQALRLADDLDGRNSIREWNADPAAFARKIPPIKFIG